MTGQLPQFAVALCAGAGVWLVAGGPPRRGSRLLPTGVGPMEPVGASVPLRRLMPRRLDGVEARLVVACAAIGLLLSLYGRSPLPLLAVPLLTPLALRWWRGRRARHAAERRRDAVIAFCTALAGEVRAGRPPGEAVAVVGQAGLGVPGGGVVAAARYGGDVSAALRAASAQPGADGLRGVAACWAVAVDGGASLAAGLERVAGALRAEREHHEELRAQLAGPRATVGLLAALPLFGLALGAAMGVAPLQVLLNTPTGLGCLAAGALLECAGLAWIRAIVRSAERAAS
ncbi:type II secretion system F family protein [Streptomyces sp. SBT349]|uniref:type II secretion system F family protein n=1 Tax=Streptomyces sp. SBT349 TaxID=1580539 RepID=UPI00066B247D|nr:type II secretion system F family protein [Streptomyces sp. SBT349]